MPNSELAATAKLLSERVDALAQSISVSKRQARTTRVLLWVLSGLVAMGLVSGLLTYDLYRDVRETQITGCEQQNEVRAASKGLWLFVVDLSVANDKNVTEEEQRFWKEARDYIEATYAPRNCLGGSEPLELPDPPTVGRR